VLQLIDFEAIWRWLLVSAPVEGEAPAPWMRHIPEDPPQAARNETTMNAGQESGDRQTLPAGADLFNGDRLS
jgi:hypothetical protein